MFDISGILHATTVDQASNALLENPTAILIAGGSDVLIQLRQGKMAGCPLVSIRDIPGLDTVDLQENGDLLIRPLSTFASLCSHTLVRRHIPTLALAAGQVGGPQLRNVGTIGGNVCNGATSADCAPTLLTLNASLEISCATGQRQLALEAFYKGPGKVALEKGEILTGIRIAKADYSGFYGHYIKFAQRAAMDIATLGTAVHVRLSQDKTAVQELRLAFGVAAPTPIRCHQAEVLAQGAKTDESLLSAVAGQALAQVSPRSSWRASKEFRQQLVHENTKRALRQAILNAGGEVLCK